jgi:alpha-mannosidase
MASDMKLYLIGNAHIDPVWLWKWQQGHAEVMATFRSALDRMEQFPKYIFTCAGACYYRWVEEQDPDMFAEIAARVREGRWVVVGGMWIQPDCNIPSGESFARHLMVSQQYFFEKFGAITKVGYNVDSFGHNGMMPQLLRKSGMDSYVFLRPDELEKDLPGSVFNWNSPDGSTVAAFRVLYNYGDCIRKTSTLPEDIDKPAAVCKLNAARKQAEADGLPLMSFYGIGNHGGGPTIQNLLQYEAIMKDDPEICYSSPPEYFRAVNEFVDDLPHVFGDLQNHASGCYSANSALKLANRACEQRLITAEKLMATSHAVLQTAYDGAALALAWERVLFNQFHDIITGCCIQSAAADALNGYGYALDTAARLTNNAFQAMSWRIDTSMGLPVVLTKESDWILWEYEDRGTPFVVYNPCSQAVVAPVTVSAEVAGVADTQRKAVTTQRVRGERTNQKDKYDTLFLAELPAMGYRLYWVYKKKEQPSEPVPGVYADADAHVLENDFVRLQFNPYSGCISSMLDKKTGREIFTGEAAATVVIDESHCDTWAHGVYEFDREVGRFSDAQFSVVENGPVRAVLRVKSCYNQSIQQQDFILYCNSPRVEVRVKLTFNEKHKMLKLSFPCSVENPEAVYEIPYGFITKPACGREEPMQRWMAAAGQNSVAIINSGKYSGSLKGNDMRIAIARGCGYADHYGERDAELDYQDQGTQKFTYWIACQDSTDLGEYTRLAQRLHEEPVSIMETYHKGDLPGEMTGIMISKTGVVLTAFKRAERMPGMVARLVETNQRAEQDVTVNLPILGRDFTACFGPLEIKTFFIPDDKAKSVYEIPLTEIDSAVGE